MVLSLSIFNGTNSKYNIEKKEKTFRFLGRFVVHVLKKLKHKMAHLRKSQRNLHTLALASNKLTRALWISAVMCLFQYLNMTVKT